MSILNITRLTNDPEGWIERNYKKAFEEVENTLTEDEIDEYIESQIVSLIDFMEESKGRELLAIIDNYLVNKNYHKEIEEYLKETKEIPQFEGTLQALNKLTILNK
jgi:hypothetical protein